MICPKCGSNQADGSKFCSVCGGPLPVAAAPQQPRYAQPQPQPQPQQRPMQYQYQPQPGYGQQVNYGQRATGAVVASKGFAAIRPIAKAPWLDLGRLVPVVAGLLVLIFVLFTSWVESPLLNAAVDYAKTTSSTSYVSFGHVSWTMLSVIGLSDFVNSFSSWLNASSSTAAYASSISSAALMLKLYVTLWLAAACVAVAGAVRMWVDPRHSVILLRVGIIAITALTLIWIVGVMAENNSAKSLIQVLLGNFGMSLSSSSTDAATVAILAKDALAVTPWTVVSLILGLVGSVFTFLAPKR